MSLFQNFKGTMQTDFLVGGPAGIMLRKVTGGFEVRNSDGSALEDITVDNLIASTSVQSDTINEKTLNAGVTVDSVLIKDGEVDGVDVSALETTVTNHTGNTSNPHSVTASQLTDFDTEVSNNTDVAANTAARHDAVTVVDGTTIDFTLTGQEITAEVIESAIDLSQCNNTTSDFASTSYVDTAESDAISSANSYTNSAVSGLANDADVIKKDGTVAFTGDQSMGSHKLTNLAAPVDPNDAARLTDVQAAAAGIIAKAACLVATTANIADLAAGAPNSVDGVGLSVGDRILVKEQTTQTQNGIYVVDTVGTGSDGAWSRAEDFDGTPSNEVQGGNLVFVEQGTLSANTSFYLTGQGELTVDTDNLIFIVYSRVENIVAGDALSRTGTQLDVNVDDVTIEVSGDALQVKANVFDAFGAAATAESNANSYTNSAVSGLATDSLVVHLAGTETITGDKTFTGAVKVDAISENTAGVGVTIDGLLIKDGVVRGLDVDIHNTTSEATVADTDEVLIYDASAAANRRMTRANFLSGIAAANGIAKHIKVTVGTSDASSSVSIPENAVVKAVYTKVTTPYSAGGTLQVVVDGTSDLEIQGTGENAAEVANVYKSEPISDVAAANAGPVKVVVGGSPAAGAAQVIVEYVEQALS